MENQYLSDLKDAEESATTGNALVDSLGLEELQGALIFHSRGGIREAHAKRVKGLSTMANIQASLDLINRIRKVGKNRILTESGMLHAMQEGAIDDDMKMETENFTDMAGTAPAQKSAGSSSNSDSGQKELLDIHKFFERPVQISAFEVDAGTYLEAQLRVWDLYTLNNVVRAKLRNYAYLRGNLHVRIAVAGTPFHYGRLLASYQPYDIVNQTLISYAVAKTYTDDLRFCLLNYLSQAPGAFTMDVKDNQPVELICPFISTKPMHRLFSTASTAIAAGSSYPDLYDAGALYLYGLTPIGSVADAFTPIQVYVYAWMSDIELGAPTATVVGITTESGRVDERKRGPIEIVASRASEVADAVSVIPEIAPYAVASSMFLRGVAKIASLFGWSKPIIDQKPVLVKNMGFQNGAVTIGTDTNYKITLDPHQELTVDPRACGTTTDDMVISNITSVESFLTQFTWTPTDTPMTAPIWACLVTPLLCTTAVHGTTSRTFVQPTALGFATFPFLYWRGTVTYRIDIVVSAFHRGKLAIFYEPNLYQSALINASISPNKQYMKIIDLEQAQTVSFTVEWAAPRPWSYMDTATSGFDPYGDPATLPVNRDNFNGYIAVVPLTKLVSPDAVDVTVNVFVSSKDMQYNYLSGATLPVERYIVTESRYLNPLPVSEVSLNESTASIKEIAQEFFGEQPLSFRALMKRYQHDSLQNMTSRASVNSVMSVVKNNYPLLKNQYTTTPGTTQIISLYDYLRYAYLGIRGSIRYRYRISTTLTVDQNLLAYVSNNGVNTYVADSNSNNGSYNTVMDGTVHFLVDSNAGIEYEVPFYSNNLFVFSFANKLDGVGILEADDMDDRWVRNHVVTFNTDQVSKAIVSQFDFAAGEDFSLIRFQGAPYFSYLN